MIQSETEYQEALNRLVRDRDVALKQRSALAAEGLTIDEVERAMQPLLSFHAQLAEEVDWYERVRRRDLPTISRLSNIGRLLIGLRIANDLTQRELADRLGINESVVSRDERNEYHSVTIERAQRILDTMEEVVTARVEDRGDH